MSLTDFHVTNGPIDAVDVIRQKSPNISDIIQKHRNWLEYMPRIIPIYAVKCNPSPIVIQTLVALGTGFDCASKGEIAQVLSYGVAPEDIIYANPTKHVSHLNFAAEMNVKTMTVDNECELHKIAKYYPNADLVLRIFFQGEFPEQPIGEKFGCNPETEGPALIELSKSLGLNMIGVSFHVGSNCGDRTVYGKAIAAARKLFDFAQSVGYDFNMLDIGGGFAGRINEQYKFREMASIVNQSIEEHFPSPNIKIIAEPGRYYVTSAYTPACQVYSKREIRKNDKHISTMYYLNDGVYNSFFKFLWARFVPSLTLTYPITLKCKSEEMFKSTIWGPSCDCSDQLYENIPLPRLNVGDFMIFDNMGAYTISLRNGFNGFEAPNIEYYIERKDLAVMNPESADLKNSTLQKKYLLRSILVYICSVFRVDHSTFLNPVYSF